MKLQDIHDGVLYGTDNRSVLVESPGSTFDTVGRLPVPIDGWSGVQYRVKTDGRLKSVAERYVGQFPTVNLWPITGTVLVASADRWLFVSRDGRRTWDVSRELPASSGPMGVLPTGFCERDGTWYVGEYPLDTDATPRILRSDDEGTTWSTELALPDVRHVHSIQRDPYSGELWVTTGDVGEECSIGRLRDGELDVLGSGGQRWRAVELAFTPSSLLWGMDSVYEDEKYIFQIDREHFGRREPPVRTLHEVSSSVYYSTTLEVDGEQWVVFATADEAGPDSTAPSDRQVKFSESAGVVAASSASEFTVWHELVSYEKRRVLADRCLFRGYVPSANAYVFLAADSERGLFINPYNTATDNGEVLNVPPSYFSTLG